MCVVVVTTAAKELRDRQKEGEIERREGIQKAPERCQPCEGISSFYTKELAVNGLSERAKIKKKNSVFGIVWEFVVRIRLPRAH